MENRISQALSKLFDRHRIVFWYDAKKELRADFEALSLADVEKRELCNNEYAIKYLILREQPKQKFLLYHEGEQPGDLHNWLLDVQLAHAEFRTDQAALVLADLGLGLALSDLLQSHGKFFQAIKRKDALKKSLQAEDTFGRIQLKMLAVCVGADFRMDAILENLLQELADGKDEKIKLMTTCHLDSFFWEQMTRHYGYTSETPGIRDCAIALFKSCYAMGTGADVQLSNDALVFLKRWKDSRQFAKAFEILSDEFAPILGIEQDLSGRSFQELIELDYFQLIDVKILDELVQAVASRTVASADVALWVRQRRQSHWYEKYRDLYEAIDYAAQFIRLLDETPLDMESLADGVRRYSTCWYQIDQLYRKFTYHVRKSSQVSVMAPLTEQIENLYSNTYLLKLGDTFQVFVDKAETWSAGLVGKQRDFFKKHVEQAFLSKGNKICVLISDALRYEIGAELVARIRQENRYTAEIEPLLSMLPSYTQLGMAALLANKELALADNESATVWVDGQSSQGISNRRKILEQANPRASACKAEEFLAMNREEQRALVRDHDALYIYHNHIDAVGDKRDSEERVFEAVEETLQELIILIKKLTSANANNVLVTADHGFIYQHRPIAESDFSGVEAEGEQILFRDRRFVLGKGLVDAPGLHKFTSAQLGLVGTMEIQIPKSINRLRLQGSGSRFVHGGAALQEVVIPLIKINKKRKNDISAVDVDIVSGASSVITSNQVAVTFYQKNPVSDKVKSRTLRAGFYTKSGDLFSDSHTLTFDSTSENPRDRESSKRFMLSRDTDKVKDQEVILKLEEKDSGSSHFKEYKSLQYMVRRSFTSDFDF